MPPIIRASADRSAVYVLDMNILRRTITRTAAATFIATLAAAGVGTATAAPQPAELTVEGLALFNPANDEPYSRGISPGTTFYVAYSVTNSSDAPITVTGYSSSITTRVEDKWITQGYQPDYCDQYIVERGSTERQAFPQVVTPGDTIQPLFDNVNYEFLYAADNPCQRMEINIGTVTVTDEDDDGDGSLPPASSSSSSSSSSSLVGSLGSLASS